MKNKLPFLILFIMLFTVGLINPVIGDGPGPAPPPPGHSLNGNQASPGGTGCPIDRQDGILVALLVSLGFAGFVLYRRGNVEKDSSK